MNRLPLAITLLAALAAAGPAQRTKKAVAKIDAFLTTCVDHGWSGSVLVALHGKVLLAKGYGAADVEAKKKNTENTLFEVASTTKAVTALAVLVLHEKGKLSIDDSIAKHLPGVPERFHDITIYHLLTHTSGMPGYAPGRGRDLAEAVRFSFAEASERETRTKAVGTAFEYWNGGYALLAGIIERVSGKSYEAFCRKHVLGPADMKQSGFTGEARLSKKAMATGYDGPTPVRLAGEHPYGAYDYRYKGMGGLVTSVSEMWRLDRALRAGKILKKETREKAYTPFSRGFERPYGCGWEITTSARGTRRIEHAGDVRAFHTDFIRFDEEDGVIAVTTNVDHIDRWEISRRIEALLFGAPVRGMPPKAAKVSRKRLAKLAGTYASAAHGTLEVTPAPTGLWIVGSGDALKALAIPRMDSRRRTIVAYAAATKKGFARHAWIHGTIDFRFEGRRKPKLIVERDGREIQFTRR